MKKTAIIILNKSNNELLFKCLISIIDKTQNPNYYIYIGDTGSTEEELEQINKFIKQHKNIYLIEIGQYHFAKNHNDLIFNHLKNDEEIITFCNNDIELIDDCIDEGIKMIERNWEHIGTVGFKLLFANETIQHAGQLVVFLKNRPGVVLVTHRGLRENKKSFNKREIVIGNTMGLCMTKTETYRLIGGMNEKYIECFEDVQYNLQNILNNKYNVYIGDKKAFHFESMSRNKNNNKDARAIQDAKNTLYPFIFKHKDKIEQTGLTITI